MTEKDGCESKWKIESIGSLLVLLGIVAYIIGFIIVNSYISGIGLRNMEIFRVRYIAASALFSAVSIVFLFFVLRRVYYLDHDIGEFAKMRPQSGAWALFCGLFVITEIVFSALLSSVIIGFAIFAKPSSSNHIFLILILWFLVDYTLSVTGVWKRFPYVAIPITFLGHIIFIVLGFSSVDYFPILKIFWFFIAYGFVANFIIDFTSRFNWSIKYVAICCIGIVLTAAAYFGSVFYPHIRAEFGGGLPQTAYLIMESKLNTELRSILSMTGNASCELEILAETSDELVVRVPPKPSPMRIKRKLIEAIQYTDVAVKANKPENKSNSTAEVQSEE